MIAKCERISRVIVGMLTHSSEEIKEMLQH